MSESKSVNVPDVGGQEVEVIELCVAPGDQVDAEDALVTVEGDKASMDIPAPFAGEVLELKVAVGDKVSEGQLLALVKAGSGGEAAENPAKAEPPKSSEPEPPAAAAPAPAPEAPVAPKPAQPAPVQSGGSSESGGKVHASPAVRKLAREFGLDLGLVQGQGRKGRILVADVQAYIKQALASGSTGASSGPGLGVAPAPKVDFAKFGPVETQPLTRIQKASGANLHRNWVTIPHVTQFDEADITELEAFRKQQNAELKASQTPLKITPLVFIMKAVAKTLALHPTFNSSLSHDGASLVLKRYVHLGIAVDTPNGLVVPVIRDVDKKGVHELSRELGEISQRARDGKLSMQDMQGSCFAISSLGGIGGTAFTPIINGPDVAILGVSRSQMQPRWNGSEFVPRLMLPLSLSYDHRVIDGALAARFTTDLAKILGDLRRLVL